MNKTLWKSEPEINTTLADYHSIGILSCGVCANLSYTGGKTGLNILNNHLKSMGKEIPLSRVILACCPEEIMRQSLKQNRRRLKKCDALVVLSCAAGIKAANSCKPGLPVINILDSIGSAAVACTDPVLAESLCSGCGHCVLTFTSGICPVSACPAKRKYGPCKQQPPRGSACPVDTSRECAWHLIEARGGRLDLLEKIKEHHKAEEKRGLAPVPEIKTSVFFKKFFAWHAARIEPLEWVIRHFRK